MAVIAFQRFLGGLLVQGTGLVDEFQKFQRGLHGKVEHFAQAQLVCRAGFPAILQTAALVSEDFVVQAQVNQACVLVGDDGMRAVSFRLAEDVHIKVVARLLFQLNADSALCNQLFAVGYSLGRTVVQHLQLVFALADERAQCNGDGQPHHSRAGYAYAHGVFQNVGAQAHRYLLRSASERFGGVCHAQRHAHRFGTSDCGHHLALHQSYNLFLFHAVSVSGILLRYSRMRISCQLRVSALTDSP